VRRQHRHDRQRAMLMACAEWMFAMGRRSEQVLGMGGLFTEERAYFEALPLARVAEAAGVHSPWWNEWLSHPTCDAYWRSHGYEECWTRMTVPALSITGVEGHEFLGCTSQTLWGCASGLQRRTHAKVSSS